MICPPSPSLLSKKAYSLWEQRGKPEGTAQQDYAEAERLYYAYMGCGGLYEIGGVFWPMGRF